MIRGGFFRYFTQYLEGLPICSVDSTSGADKRRRARVIELVDNMAALFKEVGSANTPDVRTQVERQISVVNKQIDTLVYELYRLTDEEITIIERETS